MKLARTILLLSFGTVVGIAATIGFQHFRRAHVAALFDTSHTIAGAPTLKVAEVIQLANAVAQQNGCNLAHFKPPEAHYQFAREDDSWFVFYQGKRGTWSNYFASGNHFAVTIHDKTKKTVFMGGI